MAEGYAALTACRGLSGIAMATALVTSDHPPAPTCGQRHHDYRDHTNYHSDSHDDCGRTEVGDRVDLVANPVPERWIDRLGMMPENLQWT